MSMNTWQTSRQTGAEWLATRDTNLAELVARFPLPNLTPHKNYYQELVESIISQQLSVKAAASITKRFIDHFGHFPTPKEIIAASIEDLRGCGLSYAKVRYIQDLATHVYDGTVTFDHLDQMSNEQIIAELTTVKGIGEWTVHMFLIFCMGRLDVLATGDLGVRTAMQRLYKLPTLPKPVEMHDLATANQWHPYESIACWYLWQSLDNTPKTS
jgi:DNA-3-methyladenine glycosylase II